MEAETRIALIHLGEEIIEGLKRGSINLSEEDGRTLNREIRKSLYKQGLPEHPRFLNDVLQILDVSAPTFNKWVKEGLVPKGLKYPGAGGLIWSKKDIDSFRETEFYKTWIKKKRK